MRSQHWPALCGRERERFRDEYDGSGRLVVADRADGQPGAVVVIPDSGERGSVYLLGPWDVEVLIRSLQEKAAADAIHLCAWCDTLGMIDADDGPEFCAHPPGDT